MNESFTNTLLVEVAGSPLPADVAALLTYAYVEDSRNVPDMFLLRFRDPQHLALGKASLAVGKTVTLKVVTAEPGAPQQLMSGEVTSVELELDRTGTMTQVRGLGLTHRLSRGRRVAAYPNMTVSDVVRKVAQRAGLKVGKIDALPGVGGKHGTQLSQDNVSDWDFLTRLADLVGAQFGIVDGALEFRLPTPPDGAPDPRATAATNALVLESHRNLLSLQARLSAAEQVASVEVRGWDVEHKQKISATATPHTAGTEVTGADPVKLGNDFGAPPYLAANPGWHTPAIAKAAAGAIAAQLGGACAELHGLARGNPKLRAGTAVALAGVGDPFAGKYTLTTTRHVFSEQAGYTTEFTASGRQDRSLYGLVTGRGGGDRPVRGLVPAIVSDVRDPMKLGRVKLTFPWLDDNYTSDWARTVQAGAGKDRGALILPEVGDEVLAGFGPGGLDEPYVLGGLHNGKDTAPTLSAAPVDRSSGEIAVRAFVSRAGHRIQLVEDDGIEIATGDGKLSVWLDKKKGTVQVKGSKGVTVDAGGGTLELKGQKVTVDAGSAGTLELKGQKVTMSAAAEAELSANGQMTVRGGIIKLN